MYIPDQAIAYPSRLHINRCTNIKMVPNKTFPRWPIYDEGKKKGFKLYFNEEMPAEVRRYNWSTTHGTGSIYSKVKSSSERLMLIMLKPHGIKRCGMTPRVQAPPTLSTCLLQTKGIPFKWCIQPKCATLMMQMLVLWRTLGMTSLTSFVITSLTLGRWAWRKCKLESRTFMNCNKLIGPSMKLLRKSSWIRKLSRRLM